MRRNDRLVRSWCEILCALHRILGKADAFQVTDTLGLPGFEPAMPTSAKTTCIVVAQQDEVHLQIILLALYA